MDTKFCLPGWSGSALKVIAMVSMVTDHIALYFLKDDTFLYGVMRCVGRIAFPVFAFLIAEGFTHTRNRMRYFLTLLGFAAVSELPWHLLNGSDGTHNVMFTLALGVAVLAAFERLDGHKVICYCTILLTAWLATWSGVDYEWRGILMIVIFYLFQKCGNTFPSHLCRMAQLLFTFPLMMHYGVIGAMLACTVILFYNGRRGFIQGNVAKYGFYAFYPAHLFILVIIVKYLYL